MGVITVGNNNTTWFYNDLSGDTTSVDLANPANDSGVLSSLQVVVAATAYSAKFGTFSKSGSDFTLYDSDSLGTVTSGSTQTFTGKSCDVQKDNYLGYYQASGGGPCCAQQGQAGVYYHGGDHFIATPQTLTSAPNYGISVYATGASLTAPTVTTQAATSITSNSCTGNGNITATGGANATRRGFAYKVGTTGDPTISDSIVYDDGDFGTGAFTKTIAPLKLGTHYRVAAYATNSAGTSYGSTVEVFVPADNIFGWTT